MPPTPQSIAQATTQAPTEEEARALVLGVDTGGTYTDAVLFDRDADAVWASAKAPTTHDALSIGIDQAIDRAIAKVDMPAEAIRLVAVSTTLATNALVEGKGRPAGLIAIGFEAADLDRAGLQSAIGADPVVRVAGGHNSHGQEVMPLDLERLEREVRAIADRVDAFAVASVFSVRNTTHELQARDLIRRISGKPVTCSHELSARLNGPRRALTALLNARLIAPVTDLLAAMTESLAARSIAAPLMVMRGDGSLVSADFMRDRPIETILSGPAASIVGATHLLLAQGHAPSDAVVADIGGTTTDIAVVRDGVPQFSPDGAVVGRHHTMVHAVRMHTHGLGGDSLVEVDDRATTPTLRIGPRRVVPLSQLAMTHRDAVASMLTAQLDDYRSHARNNRMIQRQGEPAGALGEAERALLDRIGRDPVPMRAAVTSRTDERTVERLMAAALVIESGFTPTDASHALGRQSTYDSEIAELAAAVFARSKDRFGTEIAPDGNAASLMVLRTLASTSADAALRAAFDHDGLGADFALTAPVQAALADDEAAGRLTRISVELGAPVVALGASASIYYPAVAERLGSELIIPDHAEVANAIGAAVGLVRLRRTIIVSAPRRGSYRVHLDPEPTTVHDLGEAKALARAALDQEVRAHMELAGAATYGVTADWVERVAEVEDRKMFVEGKLTLTGVGDPAALAARSGPEVRA